MLRCAGLWQLQAGDRVFCDGVFFRVVCDAASAQLEKLEGKVLEIAIKEYPDSETAYKNSKRFREGPTTAGQYLCSLSVELDDNA